LRFRGLRSIYWGVNSLHTENLFRKNAIDSLTAKQDGRPIAVMPRPWAWLSFLCIGICTATCVFCWNTQYARKETVRGWLVSEQGVVRVTHSKSAVVESVMRTAGDSVRRGDTIARFSYEEMLGNGESSVSGILAELHDELAQTDSREHLLREEIATKHTALDQQVHGIADEIANIEEQMREQYVRVTRAAANLDMLQLARDSGALTEIEFLRQQDEVAAMRLSMGRLRQESSKLNRERQELLAVQSGLSFELENGLASLSSARAELRQRITLQEQRRLVVLQAPINGTLATLEVVAGTRIRPQQLITTIVPERSQLAADVFVPSRAIGLIQEGQAVQLRYDAFPHEQFGLASGSVDSIAGIVSLPADVPQTFGVREASYKVRIAVDADHVTDQAGRYALRPGMLLAAEIVLEKRTLAQWLLAPLRARF
jgi:membrane fusion protein